MALIDAAPVLSGDPMATADVLLRQEKAAREQLEQLSDAQLLTRAARELAIAQIIVSRALVDQVHVLIPEKPGETRVLLVSLGRCLKAITDAFRQVSTMQSPTRGAADPP